MTAKDKASLLLAIGGAALLWVFKKAAGINGIGKVERIKRRIYKEVALAQKAGVDFTKKYDELSTAAKNALKRIGNEVGWKQSKVAIQNGKAYTDSYYNSLRRAWNAVSGLGGIGRAYQVRDANGNVCLTWIEDAAAHYDAEQRTLEAEQRAMEARRRLRATRRSVSGTHRTFGGNSGYSGYSMSKRAIEARNEGKYPKNDFRRIYKITEKSLQALVELEYISNTEWHHTSSWGNRTTFYAWEDEEALHIYQTNKRTIDKLARENNLLEIMRIFGEDEDYIRMIEERQQREAARLIEDEENKKRQQEEAIRRTERIMEMYPDGIYPFDSGHLQGYIDLVKWYNGTNILSCVVITSPDKAYHNDHNKWFIVEDFNKLFFSL